MRPLTQAAIYSPVEIVRYIYDAYDSGDARTPGEYFHDDVEGYVSEFVPWGGSRHGIADVRDGLMLLREHVASTFEPSEIIDSGSYVVAVGRTVGFVHVTGRSFSVPTVHVWHFEDCKVVAFTNYLDRQIVAALEPAA